jgi:hypothetical protein
MAATKIRPISLSLAKSHLRIEHVEEDTYITLISEAATGFVDNYCEALETDSSSSGADPTPKQVQQAMLLIIGYYYENREDAGMNTNQERSVTALLRPYRLLGYVEEEA